MVVAWRKKKLFLYKQLISAFIYFFFFYFFFSLFEFSLFVFLAAFVGSEIKSWQNVGSAGQP